MRTCIPLVQQPAILIHSLSQPPPSCAYAQDSYLGTLVTKAWPFSVIQTAPTT